MRLRSHAPFLAVLAAACATRPPPHPPSPALPTSSPLGLGCVAPTTEAENLALEADNALLQNQPGAIARYLEAVKLAPDDHRLLFKLVLAYKKSDRWDDVAKTARRAADLAPTFASYWYEVGNAREMLAKLDRAPVDEAKEAYSRCIEADPNFAACYAGLGEISLWAEDEQAALEHYDAAIRRAPNALRHYLELADLYLRIDHATEAEAVLREALKRGEEGDKRLVDAHVLLAQALEQKGDPNGSIGELEAADAMGPGGVADAALLSFSLGQSYALLAPPKKVEAIRHLIAFNALACKGDLAQRFNAQCETARILVTRLGATFYGGAPTGVRAEPRDVPAPERAPAAQCIETPKPYPLHPTYVGIAASLPPIPTVPHATIKMGDTYTVTGLVHRLRSRLHSKDVEGQHVTVFGYVVKTNYADVPKCGIHRTGKGDPADCKTPIPAFAIADDKGGSGPAIQVLGWASNFAQVYTMIQAIDSAPKGWERTPRVRDEFWGQDLPNPIPNVGAKVSIEGTYGTRFTKAFSGPTDPHHGILAVDTIKTIEVAPEKAYLPGMTPRN